MSDQNGGQRKKKQLRFHQSMMYRAPSDPALGSERNLTLALIFGII